MDNQTTPNPQVDPLAKLHHMSTTAGLGTQEYVAINPVAVWATIFGLGSLLCLVDNIFLVIPLAAIVCAFIALRQIKNSNGTQTGKGLVALGLILSIGLAGFIGSRAATAAWRTRSDREAIGSLVTNWGNKIMGSDYDGAYALCSPRFHQHVSKQKFTDFWTYVRDKAPYGNVAKVEWNEQAGFETQRDTGLKLGYSIIILTFAKNPEPSRQEAIFAQEPGGTWQIESLPNIFPPEQPKK